MPDETSAGETGGRERHLCMISTCSWYYERPSQPTTDEVSRALIVGFEAVSRDRAMRTDAILRGHFETHTLEQWCVEINRERKRADTAERELAEMRERIGFGEQLSDEWGWTWRGHDRIEGGCNSEETARSLANHGDTIVRRIVSKWKPADGG